MKSEEKSIQAISAQAHGEAADNRLLRKKLLARDKRVEELEAMVSSLNKQLCEKVDQLNDMMQKLVAFMTGNGEVTLSDSLREAVVAGIRAEYEAREKQLKGIKDGDNPTTTMPGGSNSDKYHHNCQQTESADDMDLNGEDVPDEKVVEIAKDLEEHKDMKGVKKPRRPQPLLDEAKGSTYDIPLRQHP